jgi:hypothetical protein
MTTKAFSRKIVTPIRFQLIREKSSNPLTLWMNGFTADVSLNGLKITAPMSDEDVETLVRRYALIKLLFQLPGTSKVITATAAIAYFVRGETVSNATMVTFGVSFVTIDYSDQDAIGAFILQRTCCPTIQNAYRFLGKKVIDVKRKSKVPCFA